MTTIAAGSSANVALPAGSVLTMSGLGTHQTTPPGVNGAISPKNLAQIGAQPLTIGPLSAAVTVSVVAAPGGPGVIYTVRQIALQISYDPIGNTSYATFAGVEQPLGGTVTINGQTGSVITLTAGNVGAVGIPVAWAASAGGGTPTLTSGTAVVGTAFQNTTAGYTTLTPPIDGIPGVQFNDVLECLVAGTYTLQPAVVQSAAQIAAGATTGVIAQDASRNLYYVDGGLISLAGIVVDLFTGQSFLLIPTGNNTTVWTAVGATTAPATVGTVTARSGQLASLGFENRLAYLSAAAVSSNALVTTSSSAFQSVAPSTSAFFPAQRGRVLFSVTDALTACRTGAGFMPATPSATVEASAQINAAWFAADSTDSQLSFMTCSGTGTATKTVLNGGTGFPANTNGADVYDCYVELLGGATRKANYYIMNRATGVKASGQVTVTLPDAGTLLRFGVYRNTAANATAAAFDVCTIAGGGYAQMGPTS